MIGLKSNPVAIGEIDNHLLAVIPKARSAGYEIFGCSGGTHVCQAAFESLRSYGTEFGLCLLLTLADSANGFGVKGK